MPDEPLPGATKWTREGIEPARAYWNQVEAYRDAIIDIVRKLPDAETPQQRLELQTNLLTLLNKLGVALNRLNDALHVIEVIGIKAKRDRLDNDAT